MNDTSPPGSARPTPPHARPFSRPHGRPGERTPLSTRAVLFVPVEPRAEGERAVRQADSGRPMPAPAPADTGSTEARPADGLPPVAPSGVEPPAEIHPGEADIVTAPAGPSSVAAVGGEVEPLAVPPEEEGPAEAVARTLESLAVRVRRGELELPRWIDGADASATLAGLLAALLAPSSAAAATGQRREGAAGGEARP